MSKRVARAILVVGGVLLGGCGGGSKDDHGAGGGSASAGSSVASSSSGPSAASSGNGGSSSSSSSTSSASSSSAGGGGAVAASSSSSATSSAGGASSSAGGASSASSTASTGTSSTAASSTGSGSATSSSGAVAPACKGVVGLPNLPMPFASTSALGGLVDLNGDHVLDFVTAGATIQVAFGKGDGTFGAPTSYPASVLASAVTLADVSGDGLPDIVFLTSSPVVQIAVMLNNGDGTFAGATTYAAGTLSSLASLVVADLDGDGAPDFAVATSDEHVSVLLNQGKGTFAAMTQYPTSSFARNLATIDLTGSGKPSLAFSSSAGSWAVGILPSQGHGTFGAEVDVATGANDFLAADLNGDKVPDLVVTDNETVVVYLNAGDGTFGAGTTFTGFSSDVASSAMLFATDVDGDGTTDVLVIPSEGLEIDALLNQGAGALTGPVTSPLGGAITAVVRDMDGDGRPELVVGAAGPPSVFVVKNLGGGSFGAAVGVDGPTNVTRVVVGDVNGDGQLDIAAGGASYGALVLVNTGNLTFPSRSAYYVTGYDMRVTAGLGDLSQTGRLDMILAQGSTSASLTVFQNQGGGAFTQGSVSPVDDEPTTIVTTDLDRDGKVDIVVGTSTIVDILKNEGGGTFTKTASIPAVLSYAIAMDLDGDGFPDIVGYDKNSSVVNVFLNDKKGGLQTVVHYPFGYLPSSMATVDVDGDGRLDIVAVTGDARILFAPNHGDGTLGAATSLVTLGGNPTSLVAGDFDGDGLVDLAVLVEVSKVQQVATYLNKGGGSFVAGPTLTASGAQGMWSADLDTNGLPDLLFVEQNGDVSVAMNQGGATFGAPMSYAVDDFVLGLVTGDVDGDGRPDVLATLESGLVSVGADVLLTQCLP